MIINFIVVRSRPESSGVVLNRLESFGVVRSRLESSRDIRSRSESSELSRLIRNRSWSESTGAVWFNVLVIRLFLLLCFFVFHFTRALLDDSDSG